MNIRLVKSTHCILGLVFLAAIFFRLWIFVVSITYLPVTSDETLATLQAKQILEGQRPLFIMANPYQFPWEAYLTTPFVHVLPRNALGARLIPSILSLLAFLFGILFLKKINNIKNTWPGYLLFLFPSTYLLVHQFGYIVPNHASSLFLWLSIVFLAYLAHLNSKKYLLFLVGCLCGFAFSVHMLSISLIAPTVVFLFLGSNIKTTIQNTLWTIMGICIGLIPYMLGLYFYPEANTHVTAMHSLWPALKSIWHPTLVFTVPAALGLWPPLTPDISQTLCFYSDSIKLFMSLLIVGIVLSSSGLCLWQFIRRFIKNKWPSLTIFDVFNGIIWLCLLLFILNKRSDSHTYRYLLPLVIIFPFIVMYLYISFSKSGRILLGMCSIIMALINIFTSYQLMNKWKKPNFAFKYARLGELRPTIYFLQKNHIQHAYSNYRHAYRLNYLTDNQLIVSTPYNERFQAWPIPYKTEVDQSKNTAYILSPDSGYLTPGSFKRHMAQMHVTSQEVSVYGLTIFYNFESEYGSEVKIPSSIIQAFTSTNQTDTHLMNDGLYTETYWRTMDAKQHAGMWIELQLKDLVPLSRISLHYGNFPEGDRPFLHFLIHTQEGWKTILKDKHIESDKFQFLNHHPVYPLAIDQVKTLRFKPTLVDKIKIEIVRAHTKRNWKIGEIELFTNKTSEIMP